MMAKLHSKKKGRSGSQKSRYSRVPEWNEFKAEEVEELVVKSSKDGSQPSTIGLILRDTHGVGNVRILTGKTIVQILKENNASTEIPETLMNLIRQAVRIRKHLGANKSDRASKVKLLHAESKIHRLVKYYKRRKILPASWFYTQERGALLVK